MLPEHWSDPEWKALLRAIRLSPDDDLPRLVAADWLEEHGRDIHARFIRRQIAGEVVGLPLSIIDPAVEAFLGCQPHEAARANQPGYSVIASKTATVVYWRGFVDSGFCALGRWVSEECPDCDCGRIPGCGKEMGWHPFTTITITDREPERFLVPSPDHMAARTIVRSWAGRPIRAIDMATQSSTHWIWNPIGINRNGLPDEIWNRPEISQPIDGTYYGRPGRMPKYFPAPEAANEALSKAVAGWSRARECTRCKGGTDEQCDWKYGVHAGPRRVVQVAPCSECNGTGETEI